MPTDAPSMKIDATRGYGAKVVLYDRFTESREDIAGTLVEKQGLTLIPPFDHPLIIAGQGTVGLEIAEDIGLDAAALAAHFDDGEDIPDIHEANARAHRLGINGVPAFSFPGNLVISGAQEPPVLVRMIDAAGVMAETTAEIAT